MLEPDAAAGGVYPRGCGGAASGVADGAPHEGLSPRVRGSQAAAECGGAVLGSIPAGAGEPAPHRPARAPARVYPRGCGGAQWPPMWSLTAWGLSPRVRGSRCSPGLAADRSWSIPAGAGEPCRCARCSPGRRVYPRGCGGAQCQCRPSGRRWGLSPRVRGSQDMGRAARRFTGSIPAGAGEPPAPSPPSADPWVYPRGCGGAPADDGCRPDLPGLSPRVRGSHRRHGADCARRGSIPAGAGEPSPAAARWRWAWVYPRGCGGAEVAPLVA